MRAARASVKAGGAPSRSSTAWPDPSAARQEVRAALVARYRDPGLAARRARAERLYAAFAGDPPPR